MKGSIYFLRAAIFLGIMSVVLLLQVDCSSNNSNPSSPGSAPTATPTATSTPVLAIDGIFIRRANNSGILYYLTEAWLQLGGQPVSTAGVTLSSTGAGVNLPVPYSGPATNGTVFSYFTTSTAFTYTPGQIYVLSATASGQTASITMTAPGGNITPHADSNGAVTQFTDTVAGGANQVVVQCTAPSTLTYNVTTGSGNSFNISDSGVSNVYAAPGTLYTVVLNAENNLTSVAGYPMGMDDQFADPVTVLDNHWLDPYISYSYDTTSGASYGYQLALNVQGTAPTGAGVTVTDITASHSLAIPYSNGTSSGGVTYARYATNSTALAYTPGDTYVFSSTTTAAGRASVTLVAPGAVTAVDQDVTTNAITLIGWQYPGNDTANNSVSMNETSPSSVPYGIANPSSPVNFLNSFYTGGTGSVYLATVNVYSKTATVNNGIWDLGSPIEIGETYTQSFIHN